MRLDTRLFNNPTIPATELLDNHLGMDKNGRIIKRCGKDLVVVADVFNHPVISISSESRTRLVPLGEMESITISTEF